LGLLDELYRTYRERVYPQGRATLFLDEIQRVPEWERWVRTRTETEDIKVFLTGSSSALLSREFGTLLTGRHVQFEVWPLSFGEFLEFRGIEVPSRPHLEGSPPQIQHALTEYLRWGGFPEVVLADDEERKSRLLKQYFDDVLYRDVALRHEIRDLPSLRALAVHLMTLTASLVSFTRLSRVLGISADQARAYCGYLEEAFLVELLPYLSLKLALRRRHPKKVHAVDTGLRNAACLTGSPDLGRLAETAAFRALRAEGGGELSYWRGQGEVDLARRVGTRIDALVQVAWSVEDAGTLEREVAGLEETGAEHAGARKVLVVARPLGDRGRDLPASIEVIPLWRFLLGEEGSEAGSSACS
jgi:predicted AAA+ superfamily ATPase